MAARVVGEEGEVVEVEAVVVVEIVVGEEVTDLAVVEDLGTGM